jgi:UDPglucose 6-dehydrogenase/GDP-mannose 6-dehydrogenase
MKVSIVGTGYVGLVSGVCLAERGHYVTCVDIDPNRVEQINQGITPIHEEGLDTLLEKNLHHHLFATTDLSTAIQQTELSIIAVGTPFNRDQIDLTYIRQASAQIGAELRHKPAYHLVVVKSTVVPGTTDEVVLPALEAASGKTAGIDFGVGMNPEFLREGVAVKDFLSPDRIVLGAIDDRSLSLLEDLYRVFEDVDILKTNNKTAEMIKYTSNSLFATMISFSNEIGNLCAAIGDVDVVDVMRGVHLDRRLRVTSNTGERLSPAFVTYLEAGCGFGGSCFPKDVKSLAVHGTKAGRPMRLLKSVIDVNQDQHQVILDLLKKHFPLLTGIQIAILGLAFKPGTDDIRESPAIPVISHLLQAGARIRAYDPVAKDAMRKLYDDPGISYCDDLWQTIDEAEAIVLLTRWDEFHTLPGLLKQSAQQPLFIDGRRMLDKTSVARYEGIGLSSSARPNP